jgi:glucose/arabinose dehydrogenase
VGRLLPPETRGTGDFKGADGVLTMLGTQTAHGIHTRWQAILILPDAAQASARAQRTRPRQILRRLMRPAAREAPPSPGDSAAPAHSRHTAPMRSTGCRSVRGGPLARGIVVSVLVVVVAVLAAAPATAATLPVGFQDTAMFSGLDHPTAVRFSRDGRVFVAQQDGIIKVFRSVTATTGTTFADLRREVDDYSGRGLLGLALDPRFPKRPYVYVLYAYDAPLGATAPVWNDACSDPAGNGCVISGRLSRLTASGDVSVAEQPLVSGWCQQYTSHSIGALVFGPDDRLYASGGDGASFNFADWGQHVGNLSPTLTGQANVCGDPVNEGGALRSQDLRTTADPTALNGAILRLDPNTGAAAPGNPYGGGTDPNAARIVAEGLRNPFRFTFRPGTSELWIGDVGWRTWEEIDRMPSPKTFTNFGWPCYEGAAQQSGYGLLGICRGLYAAGSSAVAAPYYAYQHGVQVVPGETCPTSTGSSITGLAFAPAATTYPAPYKTALFFADRGRKCIWAMLQGKNRLPDPASRRTFEAGAANPVDLEIGPDGNLYYADLDGGTIRRITWSQNRRPVAKATASPTSGAAPLTVQFDATGSTDPDGDRLTYSWDLNGDGVYGDATSPTPSHTYPQNGQTNVGLRVSDGRGGVGTDHVTITVGGGAPTATITTPPSGTLWKVGDVISFRGSATDPVDGQLPTSALSWKLILRHCPTDANSCDTHDIQTWHGVSSGSFTAPDTPYPAYLKLQLTATDSRSLSTVTSMRLDPRTVQLTLASTPPGQHLSLTLDETTAAPPIVKTVIQNSKHTVDAPSQEIGDRFYEFKKWSDGQPARHTIIVTATSKLTATFKKT